MPFRYKATLATPDSRQTPHQVEDAGRKKAEAEDLSKKLHTAQSSMEVKKKTVKGELQECEPVLPLAPKRSKPCTPQFFNPQHSTLNPTLYNLIPASIHHEHDSAPGHGSREPNS